MNVREPSAAAAGWNLFASPASRGVLEGFRVLEMGGLGPGPLCAMLLADLGAEVISVRRPSTDMGGEPPIVDRGKRSVILDLKQPSAIEAVLRLIDGADALMEGMRPGVMERLGLGPEVCLARKPSLVYGRMTGWGQTGPWAQRAGHDANYSSLAGAFWLAGEAGTRPQGPPTLVGDCSGALYLAVGILAGVLRARADGTGQVVDAAIVDGIAHMMTLILGSKTMMRGVFDRGTHALDASHWSCAYRCRDGRWIYIQALEPQFYMELLIKLGLDGDARFVGGHDDMALWPQLRQELSAIFATRDLAEWCEIFEGSDACWSPVLRPDEACDHPHLAARGSFVRVDGILQGAAAPRFSNTPSAPPEAPRLIGGDTRAVLTELGFGDAEIASLRDMQGHRT